MRIEYDPAKNAKNIEERGLPFTLAGLFDWDTALFKQDTRRDYAESRYVGIGYIGDRLHVMVFTYRKGGVRVISLRKANEREMELYEEAT